MFKLMMMIMIPPEIFIIIAITIMIAITYPTTYYSYSSILVKHSFRRTLLKDP